MTMNTSAPIIPRPEAHFGSFKQHSLKGITADRISAILGFEGNHDTDTEKCAFEWRFSVDGQDCSIWDYKGSHLRGEFSAWGPRAVLNALFPDYLA